MERLGEKEDPFCCWLSKNQLEGDLGSRGTRVCSQVRTEAVTCPPCPPPKSCLLISEHHQEQPPESRLEGARELGSDDARWVSGSLGAAAALRSPGPSPLQGCSHWIAFPRDVLRLALTCSRQPRTSPPKFLPSRSFPLRSVVELLPGSSLQRAGSIFLTIPPRCRPRSPSLCLSPLSRLITGLTARGVGLMLHKAHRGQPWPGVAGGSRDVSSALSQCAAAPGWCGK